MKFKDKIEEINKQFKKDKEEILKNHTEHIQNLKNKYEEAIKTEQNYNFNPKKWLKVIKLYYKF